LDFRVEDNRNFECDHKSSVECARDGALLFVADDRGKTISGQIVHAFSYSLTKINAHGFWRRQLGASAATTSWRQKLCGSS
jgi:hypothetical protein